MNVEAQKKEPYITMKDGLVLHLLNPKKEQIRISDIAWHLAGTCRYNRHIAGWYSNAEHSVLASWQASNVRAAQYVLLHDAAEYAFGDLTSPVKRMLPLFKQMIDKFQDFIWTHFCGEPISPDIEAELELIDKRLTATEMKKLRHQPDSDLGPYEPYPMIQFYCCSWEYAHEMFMAEFHKLFPGWE